MNFKSFFLISVAMLAGLLIGCGQDTTVYRESGMGYNGAIEIEVEIADEQITAIRVVDHSETQDVADPAFEQLIAAVLENQHTDIDVVSGATYTSRGFLQAVENALLTASGEAATDAARAAQDIVDRESYADGRYRGAFGDRGETQVVIQFHLRDGILHDLSYRHLYHSGNDYRQMDNEHELYPVKVQHDQILEYLDGKPLASIDELRNTGSLVEDIDGYTGATIRGNKIYSAMRDALNRGLYTPAGAVDRTIGNFADGRYRGTFGDRGDQQVSIQFELENNTFSNLRYRHLYYGGVDYRQIDSDHELYPVYRQHMQLAEYLEGQPVSAVFDLYDPGNVIDDIDGFTGATVRANKVLSAIMNALTRDVYVPADPSRREVRSVQDGRYRGIYEDSGVQQISIQFSIADGKFHSLSYRHLYYSGDDYRRLEPGDELYPVVEQHQEILAYLEGKSLESVFDLHTPGDFVSDIDGFTGATIRGNKVFSAIMDGLNRGIY
ncbi:FMN-binding protein [Spirochaeta africana]|uniref:FMN-binding domain-containing protein n=1 Tax=Spirochaeta africana (strain ATCC 700263 / DSM 8902 / Z-7692) TaxID=889378 RepID=H9UIG2_SPIAZ|nr:FMN-binding protein [Spirochaeta africana]AFG37305.1 hypothetical protein Spiaf_1227 [Spirochaeta africana DSM 8902]